MALAVLLIMHLFLPKMGKFIPTGKIANQLIKGIKMKIIISVLAIVLCLGMATSGFFFEELGIKLKE